MKITNKYSEEKVQYILKEYQKGRNTKEIATELGTYNTTIRRILKRNMVIPRSNQEVQSIVKHDLFKYLTPETSYWIGLLATDGCITNNNIVLELKEEDEYILHDFIEWSKFPLKVTTSYSKKYDKYLKRISFKNKESRETLISYGITERKSLTLELKIPFNRDILRGIIDGDGSFSSMNKGTGARCQITTISEKFALQIQEYLKTQEIHSTIVSSLRVNTNYRQFTITVCRKKDINKLYAFLYSEASYFLKRKYEKIGSLLMKVNK